MMAKRLLLALASAALTGCLFGTSDDRVAGGAEDFPNTLQPLGMALNDDISTTGSGADWDQFSNIPQMPSFQGTDSLAVDPNGALAKSGDGAGAGSLAKVSAEGKLGKPDTLWDYSDTASLGVVRRFIDQETLTKIKHDTTVFRYDAAFKDGIAGNELVLESRGGEVTRTLLHIQAYHYFNRDSAGPLDSAVFFLRYRGADSLWRANLLAVSGGADGDVFTKGDNVPCYYAFAKTDDRGAGSDTLDAFDVSDADGDGLLWGPGDSGLVDFREKKTNPESRPGVKTVIHKMRVLLFKDEAKTYPVSYSETRVDRDGKRVTFSVKGTRPDSAFGPGDTVYASVKTIPADGTRRFSERNARFTVLLAADPKRPQDNRLVAFSLETQWRPDAWPKGGVTRTRVVFKPDSLVLSQHLAQSGEVAGEADFADGSNGSVTGRLESDRIEAEFAGKVSGKARRFKLRWKLNGDFLTPPESL